MLLAFLSVSFTVGSIYWFQKLEEAKQKVSNLNEILERVSSKPSVVLSSDGQVLYSIASEYRNPVRFDDIPQVVIDATLAAEDKRFYEHSGVDAWALLRGIVVNARAGHLVQGGSTLTMQLAKRVYTSPARTFDRKIRDMALATQIESSLTKEQILELYLNQVFYGSGAYGVAAAADVYFGKNLDRLTTAEAALLARLVRRPSHENPFADLDKAISNRNVVLRVMRDEQMIDEATYEKAIRERVRLNRHRAMTIAGVKHAPYFVDWVMQQVEKQCSDVDLSTGGYQIVTTLDSRIQEMAEREVERAISRNRRIKVTTGAFMLMDREGRVLAMVGGADYNRNQYNVITQGRRQPGSTFKPFVYATAFEIGALSPTDTISNEPFYYQMADGSRRMVKNTNGKYGGHVTVTQALQYSINVPAVRTIDKVGPKKVIELAHNAFGFSTEMDPYLPLALGASSVCPMELAEAYSVFMLGGDRIDAYGVRSVTAPDGTTILQRQGALHRNVISNTTAEAIDEMLRMVATRGSGSRAGRVPNAHGKTGTTSDFKDAWFVGYTEQLLGVGWVGNERPTHSKNGAMWTYGSMGRVFGGTFVAPLWASIVGEAQKMLGEPKEAPKSSTSASKVDTKSEVEDAPTPDQMDDTGTEAPPSEDVAPAESPVEAPAPAEPIAPNPARGPKSARAERSRQSDEVIYVEVCADSGQRATIYCPERVRRPFRAGSEPKHTCPLHRPPGP